MLETVLIVVHLLLALGLVGLVLIQHGKGADAGAAFGSGASASVFGSRGSSNFLSRTTGVLAALFFATSLALAYFAMQKGEQQGLMAEDSASESAADTGISVTPVAPVQGDVPVAPDIPVAPAAEPPAEDGGDVPALPTPAPEPAEGSGK